MRIISTQAAAAFTRGATAALVLLALCGAAASGRAQQDAPGAAAADGAGARLALANAAAATTGVAAAQQLAALASDPDPFVRQVAIQALGERGRDRAEQRVAVAGLTTALQSSDADTREIAAIAAGRLAAPELGEPLARLAADPSERVAAQALGALAGVADVRALPQLTGALQRANEGLRHRALLAISQAAGRFPGAEAAAADMPEAQASTDRWLAAAAASIAQLAGDARATLMLRQHAVLTLAAVPHPAARAALEALRADADPAVAAEAEAVATGALRAPAAPLMEERP